MDHGHSSIFGTENPEDRDFTEIEQVNRRLCRIESYNVFLLVNLLRSNWSQKANIVFSTKNTFLSLIHI